MQALIFFFLLCCGLSSSAIDTITPGRWLSNDKQLTIVSAAQTFELGFFTPYGNSESRRYLGIWYHGLQERTVVWIANRDMPLPNDTIGVFGIAEDDGKLKLLDETGHVYWFSKVSWSSSSSARRVVKLMNSGNLVLSDSRSGEIFWESFHHPTDTFLPGMKMDENLKLTSRISVVDPGTGNFTFMLDREMEGYTVFKDSIIKYWSIKRREMPNSIAYLLSNFSRNVTLGVVPSLNYYSNTRLVMKYYGEIRFLSWDNKTGWSPTWSWPRYTCSVPNACGNFGICNIENSPVCKCLPGFQPSSRERWASGDFSDGCTREQAICSPGYSNGSFLSLKMIRVRNPDMRMPDTYGEECRTVCLRESQCKCQAYVAVLIARGRLATPECWIWTNDLNTLQEEFPTGHDIYIRVSLPDIDIKTRNCEICGSNIIPYPLSTGPNCGDPLYSGFGCDNDTAHVFFIASDARYRVAGINPEERKFFIGPANQSKCDPPQLINSLPFSMKGGCNTDPQNITSDMPWKVRNDIEIIWEPPKEPICTSSGDCRDWSNSTCSKQDGNKRCHCNTNFRWDGNALNCTKQGIDSPQEGVGYLGQEGQSQGKNSSPTVYVVASTIVVSVSLACTIAYIAYLRRRKIARSPENRRSTNPPFHSFGSGRHVKDLISSNHFKEDDKKGIDVPFFELESVLAATNHFSEENKLGRGGFGPVYKGKFPGGKELAVKRLSSASGQGLEEFKNEVVLIAKLQHRNLVRLLGYCVKGDEKILLYEYMPNKSLDSFIFDRTLCMLLNWESRFDIILGIARGLIYLHQDSRLKIIHRDLKTSNILLDEDMNPKISDFGLARIFDSKQTEANTNRVVGTYGYMSPEYALDGFFSVKSDVFSFGVVVLEIISGKRNTGFYQSDQAMSLLGYAWKLWIEDKVLELMDQTVSEACNINEFLRCVNVGLLCVQEDPSDRPTMSNAFLMLSSEIATLPVPKQPAFVLRRGLPSLASSSSTNPKACSNNEITVSLEEGR